MQLKAQISVEHSVLLLIVLALLIPVMSQFTGDSDALSGSAYESIVNNQARLLVDSVNRAPLLGESSQQTITIEIPDNFIDASVENNNLIIINMKRGGSVDQFIYKTDEPIAYDSAISQLTPGRHKIIVKSTLAGVCLSYDGNCGAFCGNNKVEGVELCDGTDMFSDCISEGYTGGNLLCNNNCDGYIEDFCQ